jgi:hypothetical protein
MVAMAVKVMCKYCGAGFGLSLRFLFPVLSKIILVTSFHNLSVIFSFFVLLTRKATVPRAKNSYF